MKQRTIRGWIALAALVAQACLPFVAYALPGSGTGFGEVCSVLAKDRSSTALPSSAPLRGSDRHGAGHCASCAAGSAAAAIAPPSMTTIQGRVPACAFPDVERATPEPLFLLLPPSQAPPAPA
jgi:hypothetical protein